MSRPDVLPDPPDPAEEERLLDYLRQHPDFFVRNAQILDGLKLQHGAGGAVSLIERQVGVLRDRNSQLQRKLDGLLALARDNEARVHGMNRLAQGLIRADDLPGVVRALKQGLAESFKVDAVALGLFDAPAAVAEEVVGVERDTVGGALTNFFRAAQIQCGPLPYEQRTELFPGIPDLRSAALVPLDRSRPLGVLAIACHDEQRFTPEMGTLFLEMTAGLATVALRFHWPRNDGAD